MKKALIFLLSAIMALGVFTAVACGKTETPETIEYTITFDYGEGAGTVSEIKVKDNELVGDLPTPSVLPHGKIFAGWKTESGVPVAENTKYTFGKNITLFADYSTETYSITYDTQGGTLGAGAITSYSESNSAIALPTPTKDKYKFIGWIINDATEAITSLPAGITGNIRLTAVWVKYYFTVYLDNSSSQSFTEWADGTTGIKTVEVSVGGKITIPKMKWDNLPKDAQDSEDYYVDGWYYRDKNGNEKKIDSNTVFSVENINVEELSVNVYVKTTRSYTNNY